LTDRKKGQHSKDQGIGLGEKWLKVSSVLEEIVAYYDKVNSVISLGTDQKFRKIGLQLVLHPGAEILDLGCGPGTMSQAAVKLEPNVKGIVQSDALRVMLKESLKQRIPKVIDSINNVFEFLPFRRDSFAIVMAGFALRDSRDLMVAISEIHRVLRQNGSLLVVDLGKPDSLLKRFFVGIFWFLIVPFLAVLTIGRKGFLYRVLYLTYRRLPRNSELVSIYREKFGKIRTVKKMLNGIVILVCTKY
jgi:demethylmenaquinone methyltransferase/2-methoxy-6-polyprenyl-1,4-benzoquinol methylase